MERLEGYSSWKHWNSSRTLEASNLKSGGGYSFVGVTIEYASLACETEHGRGGGSLTHYFFAAPDDKRLDGPALSFNLVKLSRLYILVLLSVDEF